MSIPSPAAKISANVKGIISMCAAMALFTINDVLVKLAAVQLPTHQIIFVRGLMACSVMGLFLIISGQWVHWRKIAHPLVALRTGFEVFTAFTFIAALGAMAMADITAILLVSPLLITAFSALIFGEDVRWRRWLAVIVGFVGMLLVVRPGTTAFQPAALLALAATCTVAGRDLATRRLPADVPTSLITAAGVFSSTLLGGLVSLILPSSALSMSGLGYLAGAAVTVLAGNLAIVMAFRGVDVSVVSPYRYTVIIWAVIAGILVFGDMPTNVAWIGIALIVGSGLYTLYRETKVLTRKG